VLLVLAHAWIDLEDRLEVQGAEMRRSLPLLLRQRATRCANA
jgi:hypothetical protein